MWKNKKVARVSSRGKKGKREGDIFPMGAEDDRGAGEKKDGKLKQGYWGEESYFSAKP